MSKATTVKEVLQAVEWILTEVGWTQHTCWRDANGNSIDVIGKPEKIPEVSCACLLGAFDLVKVKQQVRMDAMSLFRDTNNIVLTITIFNDYPKRTKAQVLRAVRKAIKAA
jgi:hypothetical protein